MRLASWFALACGLALAGPAFAQGDYPNRPILLTSGIAAGANSDVIARMVASSLTERLGQPVVVEPRPGAGGMTAAARVATATPDGYTLVMITGGYTIFPAIYKTMPFDPLNDLQMISTVIFFPFVISVNKDSPWKSVADLIAHAKANPGKVTYGTAGVGSTQHLIGELLSAFAGVQMVHVPYRGAPLSFADLIGGRLDVVIETLTSAVPLVSAGTVRGLAVTSPGTWPSLPDMPTVAATLPGFDVQSWLGLATTKGVPAPIVARLTKETQAVLAAPELRNKLSQAGNAVRSSSPEEMHSMIAGQIAKWKKVAADASVPMQ